MNKTVLIVDDDPIVRMIIQKMIQIVDTTAICYPCENGEVGLYTLIKLQESANTVIVLLDINMPILDGWGFLDQMQKRTLAKIDKTQLYIVSSSTDESDKLKSKTYPIIKKFYNKPLSKQDIQDILKTDETNPINI